MITFKDVISFLGKDNILKWIFNIPKFYFNPKKSFRRFFSKTKREKFLIASFYSALIVLLLFLFTGEPLKIVIKNIIIEIAILAIAFILLSITKYFLDKLFKTRTPVSNVFYFLWIAKILTLPFQLIFYVLFEKTEIYELLFMHNIILALWTVLITMFSNIIFYKKTYQILCGILLNIIIYNLFFISISYLKFDDYELKYENPILTDFIYKEFETEILPIDSLINKIPIEKFLIKLENKKIVIYSFKKDSISSIKNEISNLLKDNTSFKTDVMKRDTLMFENLMYQRNKEMYFLLDKYLTNLENDIKNPIDKTHTFIIDTKDFIIKDSNRTLEITHLTMNPSLFEDYIQYIKKRNAFIEASHFADYPLIVIQIIFYPASLVVR